LRDESSYMHHHDISSEQFHSLNPAQINSNERQTQKKSVFNTLGSAVDGS